MATTFPPLLDARVVAHALAFGCGCSGTEPPRAQGFWQRLDDLTTIRSADNYRLAAGRLRSSAEQLDPLATGEPAWRVLKAEVDQVAARYEEASNLPFVGPGLNDTAWHQLEDLQRQVYEWAERLRKQGKDVPVQGPPAETSLTDAASHAAKAASAFLGGAPGQALGDRLLPTLSTGTKVALGLVGGALLLSQARPLLERARSLVLDARGPSRRLDAGEPERAPAPVWR